MKAPALAVATCLILAMPDSGNAAPGDTLYAQPGQLVAANGTRLNFYCMGSGSPAVVFDSGWEDWAPAWAVVQPRVAQWTRACSYDRAGAGFSEAGPMPRTSVRIADELHAALHGAGIEGPYILVGHAFGGNNVRTFADRYMAEVAGMVLVEADPGDVVPKAMQDEDHKGQAGIIAALRECRDAVAAGKPLPPLPTLPGEAPRTCAQQFFRGIPEVAWSPELNAALLKIAQSKVAMYDAYISEMEEVPADELYLQQNRRSFGTRPVRIITTGNHAVGTIGRRPTSLAHLKYEYEIALAQSHWLDLSSNAKQVFTRNSSEYVPFDEPAVVVDTLREVFDQAK